MVRARTKQATFNPIDYDKAQTLIADYAMADAKAAEINAVLDQQITEIREKAAPELNELEEKKKSLMTQIQVFAETNREKYFSEKKSLEMQHGMIGFRLGTPKVKGMPRKGEKMEALLGFFRSFLPNYIRTQEEINKELLIADREKDEVKTKIKMQGLEIVQTETFFIELKKEEVTK